MVLRKSDSVVTGNGAKTEVAKSTPVTSMSMPMLSVGLFGTILLVKAIMSTHADAASSLGASAVAIDVQPTPVARAVNNSLAISADLFADTSAGVNGTLLAQSSVQTTVTTSSGASENGFLLARTQELMDLDNRTVDDVAARLKAIIKARYDSDTLNIETMASVDNLRRQLAEFESLLQNANSQKESLNAEKVALEDRLNFILGERDSAQSQLNSLASQMETQLGSVQALKSETESSSELLAEKERALADLSGNLNTLTAEKDQAEQQAEMVAAQLAEREQQLEDLAAELARLSADRDDVVSSKDSADALIAEKENLIADLKGQYDQLVLNNEHVKAEAAEVSQLLAEKESNLAELQDQFAAVSADRETALGQGSELQSLVSQKEGVLADLNSQVNMLASERDEARAEIVAVGEILNEKSDLIDELTLKLDSLSNEKAAADDQLAVMQGKFEEVDSMAANFQQERDNLAGTLTLFENKATDYNSAFLSEQQEHENTKAAVAALEIDANELQVRLNGLTSERDVLLSEKQHLEATSTDLNVRLLDFQKEMETRQHELQAALTSISNLNSQIGVLAGERDSGKAAIENLQQEIVALQLELTRTQEDAEKQMISATTDFSDQRLALETMLNKRDEGIAELNNQLASLKIDKEENENFFKAQVSDQEDMMIDLKTRIAELESSRQQLAGLQSQGELELGEMQSQIAGLTAKRDMTAEKMTKLKEVNGQLTDQLRLTSEKLETVTADGAAQLGNLKEKITMLETTGATAEDEIFKLGSLNSELEAELSATRQKVEMVSIEGSDQIMALQAQVEELENRTSDLAARESLANEKVTGLEHTNQGLVDQLELAQSENQTNQSDLDKLRFNLSEYEADLNIANRQLSDLQEAQKQAEAERDAVIAEAEALRLSLTNELNSAKLENITVQQTRADNSIPIRLGNADFFAPGSAQLTKKGGDKLTKLAEIIQSYDNRRIVVEGHTDNVPIGAGLKRRFASNWELSVARAAAAVRHMQHETQIDPRNLSAAGFGEFKPVAENDTDEGRQQNRRVEVVLYPTNEVYKDEISFTGIDE